jgi:23S rRNA pseudouridine1911/1915/1917 synthase
VRSVQSVRSAIVSPDLEGPLDRAVRALFHAPRSPGQPAGQPASWGAARAWIATGKVRVAGLLVTDATARVRAGVEVSLDERARRPRAGELLDAAVVHVDPHIVVVAKPSGVSTVPYDESETDTLDLRVRDWLARRASGGGGKRARGLRPNLGIVHRLDKETSGLIVFSRTWLAKQSLARQFRKHTVHRRYLALVAGRTAPRTIRTFFVEDRGDGLRGSARGKHPKPSTGAREAVTHVEPVETFAQATLVSCRLETGRTHQIRIHLSEGGNPVLGERVYVRHFRGVRVEAPRLMLHAAELGFVHPATEREVRWEQPMPDDMLAAIERLRG